MDSPHKESLWLFLSILEFLINNVVKKVKKRKESMHIGTTLIPKWFVNKDNERTDKIKPKDPHNLIWLYLL